MSADISSNSCSKKNIDLCFIELLKEKKEGDKKWFQENQIRKKKELEDNLFVCPSCNKHHRINCQQRFDIVFGKNNYEVFNIFMSNDQYVFIFIFVSKTKIIQERENSIFNSRFGFF